MKHLRVAAKWALAAFALALLARTLWKADLAHALDLVRGVGPAALALAIPALFVLVFETIAWQVSLAPLGHPPLLRLAQVRLATDAVLMSIPGGVVISEWLIPVMLRDRCGMTLPAATAASVARKWLGTRAHALYILLAAALGWSFLGQRSPALPWIVAASALLPLSLSVTLELAASRGRVATRIWSLLPRASATRRHGFVATDAELGRVMQQERRRAATATLLYLAAWLCESVEAFVIARALGAHLGFIDVLAVEAGLSLVRSVVFFAPSGIGVQDLGYVAIFGEVGAAFVLVKRARELAWIAAGYLFLFVRSSFVTKCSWSARRSPIKSGSNSTVPRIAISSEVSLSDRRI